MASGAGAAGFTDNGRPFFGDLSPHDFLQILYSKSNVDRPSLIDLRDVDEFLQSRLRDSCSIPLAFLVARMFLLPDRATPLALVVGGPPAAQMVNGAATAGGAKRDIQLTAFLESRGWRVAFCVEASSGLWRVAEEMGVLELGGCAVSLRRRWPFQPSKLLMEQAGMLEDMLVKARVQHPTSIQKPNEGPRSSCPATWVDRERNIPSAGAPGDACSVRFRMLDVGCGSGRDLAWLATRFSVVAVPDGCWEQDGCRGHADGGAGAGRGTDIHVAWECVGLDSWHGALQRAAEVLDLGEVPAGRGGVTLHLVQIGPGSGELRPLSVPHAAAKARQVQLLRRYLADVQGTGQPHECRGPQEVAAATEGEPEATANLTGTGQASGDEQKEVLDLATLGRFDLILCVRFLERAFLQTMADLLKPGGVILFSTFVDGPGLRTFGRPQGREHVLQPDELAKSFFGPEQGFRVLRDDMEAISDGREVSMFCARKLVSV